MRCIPLAIAGMVLAVSSPAFAGDKGGSDEAIALVQKVVGAIHAEGKEKTFAAINAKNPRFLDRDLYAFVYDLHATCLAHGSNPKMVGHNIIDAQDADGRFYIKERVELAKKNASFWQDYKFPNPVTKKVERKSAYCETDADKIICVGIYR